MSLERNVGRIFLQRLCFCPDYCLFLSALEANAILRGMLPNQLSKHNTYIDQLRTPFLQFEQIKYVIVIVHMGGHVIL